MSVAVGASTGNGLGVKLWAVTMKTAANAVARPGVLRGDMTVNIAKTKTNKNYKLWQK